MIELRIVLPLKHHSAKPPRFTPSMEGDITALLRNVLLFQVLAEFERKVLERICPPLGGGEFRAKDILGF